MVFFRGFGSFSHFDITRLGVGCRRPGSNNFERAPQSLCELPHTFASFPRPKLIQKRNNEKAIHANGHVEDFDTPENERASAVS